MQIQQLTYFVAIAEQGSINKAAEKLFVTQPNLSKAISNLENELKVRIFNRTNKGVALTDEGKKLYQYARTIINQMELIQGLSEKEHAPVLSIASYPIITMGRLMAKFYNNYHDNRVALKLVENRLQQVIESVEHGEAEICDEQQRAGEGAQAHAEVQKHSIPRAGHGHLVRKPRSEPSAVSCV